MFQSIGFHAALILNRLRNERAIADEAKKNEKRDETEKDREEAARRDLAVVNKKLALLSARVRRDPKG